MRREEYTRGGLDYETRERDYDRDNYNRGYEGRGYGHDFETRGYSKPYDRDFDQNYMGRERGLTRDFDEDRGFGYGRSPGYQGRSGYGYNEGNTGQNWGGRNYSQSGYGGQSYRSFGQPYQGQAYPSFGTGVYGQYYPYGTFSHTGFYGKRNDDEIEHEVYDCLDNEWQIPDNAEIHAQVTDGVVTLTGQVRNRNAKMAAWNSVWQIAGVEDVHNNITIQSRRRQNQMSGSRTGMSMNSTSTQSGQKMGQQEPAKSK